MTPEQFAYWLQGFFELTETDQLSKKQVEMIKEHLQLVFTKVTSGGGGSSGGGEFKSPFSEGEMSVTCSYDVPEIPRRRSIYDEPTGKGRMSCSQEPSTEIELKLDPNGIMQLLKGLRQEEIVLVPPPISSFNHCGCHTRYC